MHGLLIKVQAKIIDEKVEDLLDLMPSALAKSYLQLETKAIPQNKALIALSIKKLLEIASVSLDFKGYFNSLPQCAVALFEGTEPPENQSHQVYELLKTTLLDKSIHNNDFERITKTYIRFNPTKHAFFIPYLQLAQIVLSSKARLDKASTERLCYANLNLVASMVEAQLLHPGVYKPTENDEAFLARFNQNRVLKIDNALSECFAHHDISPSNYHPKRMPCSKCGYYGSVKGYESQSASGKKNLMVYGYYCPQCGFELFDQTDVLLAGLPAVLAYTDGI